MSLKKKIPKVLLHMAIRVSNRITDTANDAFIPESAEMQRAQTVGVKWVSGGSPHFVSPVQDLSIQPLQGPHLPVLHL